MRAIHWFRYNIGKCSPSRSVYIYNRLAVTLGVSLDVETRAWSNRIWESEDQDSYVMEFTDFFCVSDPKKTVCYPDIFVTEGIDISTIKTDEGEDERGRVGIPAQRPLD